MISVENQEETVSVSEFVMLLMVLLLILFGFMTSNPNYILESMIICIIGVIMFAVYLYIKKYAKRQTLNIRIEESNPLPSNPLLPTTTIGIFTAFIPLNTTVGPLDDISVCGDQSTEDSDPPTYEQIVAAEPPPPYDQIIHNHA